MSAPVDIKALARAELDLMIGVGTIRPEDRALLVRHVEETCAGYWHGETGRLFELADGTEGEWATLLGLDEKLSGPRNPGSLGDSVCDPWESRRRLSAPIQEEVAEAMEREADRVAALGDPSDPQKIIALYELTYGYPLGVDCPKWVKDAVYELTHGRKEGE